MINGKLIKNQMHRIKILKIRVKEGQYKENLLVEEAQDKWLVVLEIKTQFKKIH